MATKTIGVDIGGTKVAAALVDASGEITCKSRVPMASTGDAAAGFASVETAINAIFEQAPEARAEVTGIGICAPGPLDPKTGVILNPPNVPCWRNFPLAAEIERVFHVPARVDNDANAAGLAEALWGAGIGYRNVFFAILGTGIGAGIVFDRQDLPRQDRQCGGRRPRDHQLQRAGLRLRQTWLHRKVCLRSEYRAANPRAAGGRGKVGDSGTGGQSGAVRAEHVGEAFRDGDAVAREIVTETAHLLTIWLGTIVDILEPDVMVVGGGVAELMSSFFEGMRAGLKDWAINKRAGEIPLVLARYGSEAGIAGAAALCR